MLKFCLYFLTLKKKWCCEENQHHFPYVYYFLRSLFLVSSTVSPLREKKLLIKKSETVRKPKTAPCSTFL